MKLIHQKALFIALSFTGLTQASSVWAQALPKEASGLASSENNLDPLESTLDPLESTLGSPAKDVLLPLEEVVVVGTRTPKSIMELAATIDVKNAETIERELSQTLSDLLRYEPGITTSGTGSRFGFGGFSIRGMGGNRVLTVVDGIRLPEAFSFGPFLNARRDFIDVDGLKRVEVARGPVSSLYGSDALGGVIAFQTRKARDYVATNDPLHLEAKAAYTGQNNGQTARLLMAGGNDTAALMLKHTDRQYEETDTQGDVGGTGLGRSQANPLEGETRDTLLNATFEWQTLSGHLHQWDMTLERHRQSVDTDILSSYDTQIFGVIDLLSRQGRDLRDRDRYSLAYQWMPAKAEVLHNVQASLYYQDGQSQQFTFDERVSRGVAESRIRESIFEQQILGLSAQATAGFEAMGKHDVTFGLDTWQSEFSALRTGSRLDSSGHPLPPSPFASPLPTRDFPITDVQQIALFAQDDWQLTPRWSVVPSVRYDKYKGSVTMDDIYRSGNPAAQPAVDYDHSAVTGKLGSVYQLSSNWSIFGNVSQGFRAPPYSDVNVGFSNPLGEYTTLPNPDLKPERSRGVELGVRFLDDYRQAQITLFDNRYKDFIESTVPVDAPADDQTGFDFFQSINRGRVAIKGAEARLGYTQLSNTGFLSQLNANVSLAYIDGEDKNTGQPLTALSPLNGVLGLGYSDAEHQWGVDAKLTVFEGKSISDIAEESARPPQGGYGVLDLLGYWQVSPKTSLNVALLNLTDKTYIRWSDTGIASADDAILRFSQPGRSLSASVSVSF